MSEEYQYLKTLANVLFISLSLSPVLINIWSQNVVLPLVKYDFSLRKIYLFRVEWKVQLAPDSARYQMLKKECPDKSSEQWQFLWKQVPFSVL